MVGAGLAVLAGVGLIGAAILRLVRAPTSVFLPPVMFMNSGNMGLPLALYAFGEEGLARQMLLFTVGAFVQSSVGIYIVSRKHGSWEFLRLPIIYAAVLGFLVNFSGIRLPVMVMRPLEMLGNLTIPLMLLLLGYKLSTIKLSSIKLPLLAASMRLGVGFGVGLLLALWIGPQHLTAKVILVYSVLPPAVANFVYAEKFQQEPDKVAATIMLGTLLSMISIPLALLVVHQW